jgi:hypothetical protein
LRAAPPTFGRAPARLYKEKTRRLFSDGFPKKIAGLFVRAALAALLASLLTTLTATAIVLIVLAALVALLTALLLLLTGLLARLLLILSTRVLLALITILVVRHLRFLWLDFPVWIQPAGANIVPEILRDGTSPY